MEHVPLAEISLVPQDHFYIVTLVYPNYPRPHCLEKWKSNLVELETVRVNFSVIVNNISKNVMELFHFVIRKFRVAARMYVFPDLESN